MNQSRGVTLVELVAALGVVALIAAISLPLYRNYIEDAEVAEIELEYESWQNRTRSALSNQEISQCADLIAGTDEGFVSERSTRLSIGVQPVGGNPLNGYRPVMHVCAQSDVQGAGGVAVAQLVHDKFETSNTVEAGAVTLDTVVSFALPLTTGDEAVCRVPFGASLTPCGQPIAVPTPMATTTTPVAVPPQSVQATPTPQTIAVPKQLAPMDETVFTEFTDPPITGHNGQWQRTDPSVWGWGTDNPDGKVEHGVGAAYGDTSGGNRGIIELEGGAGEPSNIFREIATRAGARYEFTFKLSGRVGVSSQSAGVEILWDGQVIDTIYPPANRFGFTPHAYNLVATGSSSKIEMRAVTQDGSGPVVDDLRMQYTGGGTQ